MGLFQNLLETYEKNIEAVGKVQLDADGKVNEKKTLMPIGHTTFKSEIEIRIDIEGNYIDATRDAKETTIIIPCTEKSAGRSSGIASHPLCDQLDYVGGVNSDKLDAYLVELAIWKKDQEELNAIYQYVEGKTMIENLVNKGIFKENEYKTLANEHIEGELDQEKIRKLGVRFIVKNNSENVKVWESKVLRDLWITNISKGSETEGGLFDYMSGERLISLAAQHPKNINSMTGNAKLMSANDSSGFTYRGRFGQQDDAVLVDYIQSQKMHQMLRWLIANYGYAVDTQVIVTWAIDEDTEVEVKAQDNTMNIFSSMAKIRVDSDIIDDLKASTYGNYAKSLRALLQGYGQATNIQKHNPKICIAVFDAATTGRMGLVFYQEFPKDQYLESIVNWHSDTSYYMTAWKKEPDEKGKEKSVPIPYIGAPSYDDIIFAVYGRSRGDRSYDTLKKKMRKQLLESMFGNHMLPKNMVEMAAIRASQPMSFTDINGKFSKSDWERSINITCALTRKLFKQEGEEIPLALDKERKDRDYLYGRLLSVADRIENTALYKADKHNERSTNAIKLMGAFRIKPYSTWGNIVTQLDPYIKQLNGARYYQSIIDEIMDLFQPGDFEKNTPLAPLYLLGYSAQNIAFKEKNNDGKAEER